LFLNLELCTLHLDKMIQYDNKKTISEIVINGNAMAVFYYAKWCMPCKSISQTLSELEDNFTNMIQIIAVNVDEFPAIALEQNVKSVPTLHYYKSGSLYLKESGFRTRDQLTRNMNALLTINGIEELKKV
jgi:thioredoxin 1